jgi:2',3'-cyclic-nucleotide 2'-phosphodiesterase (5'-nucleotidase family)
MSIIFCIFAKIMNKKIRFIVLLAGLCCFWLISCAPKTPDEVQIVILSFNDTHGDFENLPQLSAFVKETKNTYKNVIVADAGDRFTGNPYNDFYEKKQFPAVDLLNHIGVDVAVVGNHEFDYGIELLNERIKEFNGVEISANIELKSSGLTGIKPYYIIKKEGIKIAFLGLTNVEKRTGKPAALLERVANIRFYDPIETAMKHRFLGKKAHVFVALTHLGITEDLILADSMPELDLIIGGHSHTLLKEPLIQNSVMITHAGHNVSHVAKTTILLKKGVVSQITNEMISLDSWSGSIDSNIVAKILKYEDNSYLKEPFVSLQHDISNHQRLGYAIADAALMLPDADFSVVNCPGVRADYLTAGPVTYADILRVFPFNNDLVIVELTSAEIRKLIEAEFTEKRRCLIFPAGFEYAVQRVSGGDIKVVELKYPNGENLDETKTYRVAVNNYVFTKYLIDHADLADYTGVFMVDNIVDYFRNNPNMDYRNVRTRAKYVTDKSEINH